MNYNHAVNLQRQIMHQTDYVVKIGYCGRNKKQYHIVIDDIQDFSYDSTYLVRFCFDCNSINVKLNANSTDKNGFSRKGK